MKRALALALTLSLLLTSCSSMLEREYTASGSHEENQLHREDSYTVETYPSLLNALDSYIEAGLLSGTLRFPTTYRGNLSVDLEKARRQLLEEDPLGSYALENISYSVSKIIAYYEAELTFEYRVDRQSLSSIAKITTAEGLRNALAETLLGFDEELVCVVGNYAEEESGMFATALREAYGTVPAAALGFPELSVELYPKSGSRRLAVISLSYHHTRQSLLRDKTRTELAARRLMDGVEETPQALLEALQGSCTYDSAGGSSSFSALLDRRANGEGMNLAYALLLQSIGIPAKVVWEEDGCVTAWSEGETLWRVDAAQRVETPAPSAAP